MSRHKVSIGMPVFNSERYLEQAIECIRKQSFTDWELLISDNGSTDQTEQIATRYAELDSRIRYVKHAENRGSAWNFNYVFQETSGEYFKWHAYDDLCHESFLSKCCDLLDRDQEIVWCHSWTVRIYADDTSFPTPLNDSTPSDKSPLVNEAEINRLTAHTPNRASTSPVERFRSIILGQGYDADAYGLIRREALAKTRLELPFYGSEKVTLCELALQGKFAEIPEALFAIREHSLASGALETVQQQQEFVAPGKRTSGLRTRLTLLSALTTSVFRFPLTQSQRLKCLAALVRYLTQFSKWRLVLRQLRGKSAIRTADQPQAMRQYGQRAQP